MLFRSRNSLLKTEASSVVVSNQFCCLLKSYSIFTPSEIDPCLNPEVFENTSNCIGVSNSGFFSCPHIKSEIKSKLLSKNDLIFITFFNKIFWLITTNKYKFKFIKSYRFLQLTFTFYSYAIR